MYIYIYKYIYINYYISNYINIIETCTQGYASYLLYNKVYPLAELLGVLVRRQTAEVPT